MKKSKSIKASRAVDAAITYVILIAVAVFFFFPCLWLILASFSDSGSLYTLKGFFPEAFSFRNYQNLFTDTQMYNYPEWFGNTLFVAVLSCLFGTLLTILTAYCMSRFQFKSRKALMKTTLVLGMFPSFMENDARFGDVPFLHGNDGGVPPHDAVQFHQQPLGAHPHLLRAGADGLHGAKRVLRHHSFLHR